MSCAATRSRAILRPSPGPRLARGPPRAGRGACRRASPAARTAAELAREASRAGSHCVRCTVGMRRQPDTSNAGFHSASSARLRREFAGRGSSRSSSTAREPQPVSPTATPMLRAEVEGKNGPRGGAEEYGRATTSQACPTASDRRQSMPRSHRAGSRTGRPAKQHRHRRQRGEPRVLGDLLLSWSRTSLDQPSVTSTFAGPSCPTPPRMSLR
jgi:hypothetical protein